MGLPDRDIVYLEALIATAEKVLDKEAFDYTLACEPESHDFYGDHWDNGYDDPDEYRAIVMDIGSQDIHEKIDYWEQAILHEEDPLNQPPPPYGPDPIQRAEARVGA